jgi:hypothetical protein
MALDVEARGMAKSSSQLLMTMCQEGARICKIDGCLEGGEAEWSGRSGVSVETGSRLRRIEGGADEGAREIGGKVEGGEIYY